MNYLHKNDKRILLSIYISLVILGLVYPLINSNDTNVPFNSHGSVSGPLFALYGFPGAFIVYSLLFSIYINIITPSCNSLPPSQGKDMGFIMFCSDGYYKYDLIWIGIYVILLASIFFALPHCLHFLKRFIASCTSNKKKTFTSKKGSKRL